MPAKKKTKPRVVPIRKPAASPGTKARRKDLIDRLLEIRAEAVKLREELQRIEHQLERDTAS